MSEQRAYTVEVREQGRRLSVEPIPDPFICTRVMPRGLRAAFAVLFRRYEVEVLVGGDRDRIERVLELNPDYIGPPGSPSREAWNTQLNQAFREVGDGDE